MQDLDKFDEGEPDDDYNDNSEDDYASLEKKLNSMMRGDPYIFTKGQPQIQTWTDI